MRRFFLTFGYSGLSPKAPGTIGTLAAIPFGLTILYTLGAGTLFLVAILLTVASVKHIDAYEAQHGLDDPSEIVIDEVAGIFITLAMTATLPLVFQVITSFVAFRYFDIAKPSVIGRLNAIKGGWGVMLDDVVAGFFAAVLVHLVWQGYLFLG